MSVDPASPVPPEPAPPGPPAAPAAEPAGPENIDAVKLKRRFKKGAEAGGDEKPDQTIQLLSTLLQDLIAKKEQTGASDPEARMGKYHRLSKTGSGVAGAPPEPAAPITPAAPSSPAADPAPATPVAATVPAAASEAGASPAATAVGGFRPAPVFDPVSYKKRVLHLHILYPLGALVLMVAAYFAGAWLGQDASKAGTPARGDVSGAGPEWDDASLRQLDQALAADQAGDLENAKRLALALKKPAGSLPGLGLYLDSLLARQDHFYDVEADLLRGNNSQPPLMAAAMNEQLAFSFSRSRDFEKTGEFLAAASRTDPFSASLFYHWGETLRRQGHVQDAIARFREALARIPTGQPENESLRACAEFKTRLALVELGREGDFQKEMAERLQAPAPSGYWLLTAAAVALQHKNLADAAGLLGRARETLGAEQFDGLLNDYVFRAYAGLKELADFFPADQAARRRKLSASMAYSIEP